LSSSLVLGFVDANPIRRSGRGDGLIADGSQYLEFVATVHVVVGVNAAMTCST